METRRGSHAEMRGRNFMEADSLDSSGSVQSAHSNFNPQTRSLTLEVYQREG